MTELSELRLLNEPTNAFTATYLLRRLNSRWHILGKFLCLNTHVFQHYSRRKVLQVWIEISNHQHFLTVRIVHFLNHMTEMRISNFEHWFVKKFSFIFFLLFEGPERDPTPNVSVVSYPVVAAPSSRVDDVCILISLSFESSFHLHSIRIQLFHWRRIMKSISNLVE